MTALMWASNNGRADVVESLIKRGANVNYASKDPCPAHIVPPRSSFDCTTEAAAAAMIRAKRIDGRKSIFCATRLKCCSKVIYW